MFESDNLYLDYPQKLLYSANAVRSLFQRGHVVVWNPHCAFVADCLG